MIVGLWLSIRVRGGGELDHPIAGPAPERRTLPATALDWTAALIAPSSGARRQPGLDIGQACRDPAGGGRRPCWSIRAAGAGAAGAAVFRRIDNIGFVFADLSNKKTSVLTGAIACYPVWRDRHLRCCRRVAVTAEPDPLEL